MGALEGIRVLDLTQTLGSYCTKLLADLGADVIKVEPPQGSPGRFHGPFYHNQPGLETSLWWFFFNTNKRGVTLDLDTADGQQLLRRLAATADALVEDSEPGLMAGRGLAYDDVRQLNSRLVYTSITPYGQAGPYAHFKASDLTAQAMGNVMYRIGYPEDPPNSMGAEQAYNQVGTQAAFATLVTLIGRDASGVGQHVDVSMHEAVSIIDWNAVPRFSLEGRVVERGAGGDEARRPGVSSRRIWECGQGKVRFQLIQVLGPIKEWNALVAWLGAHGLEDDLHDGRWQDVNTRLAELPHIQACVDRLFKACRATQLMEEGQARGLAVMAFGQVQDLFEDPQLVHERFFVQVPHEDLDGPITYPGPPYRLSETPAHVQRRAPHLGEHNGELYVGELGLTAEELERLRQARCI